MSRLIKCDRSATSIIERMEVEAGSDKTQQVQ